eukprot:UN05582
MAVIASIISNIGVNVQKYSHTKNDETPKDDRIEYYFRPLWWFGFSGVLLGAILDFVALGLGNQSLVTALGGSTVLICNV